MVTLDATVFRVTDTSVGDKKQEELKFEPKEKEEKLV